jgi:hypothetical protein
VVLDVYKSQTLRTLKQPEVCAPFKVHDSTSVFELNDPTPFRQPAKIINKCRARTVFFWHMNCGKRFMARKMNALKLALETRGQAAVTNRQPVPQVALYLMQPHLQTLKISPPRRRLQVVNDVEAHAEASGPVKIIHTV